MIPMCVDLTLMMMLSIVCQADDGTIVDLRTDDQQQPLGLFSTPSLQTSTHTDIKTKTFSSSDSNNNDNDDNNDDNNNNDFLPYCDLEHTGSCFDRQDDSSKPGFFECRNGDHERDYKDCKDAGDHPDEQLDDDDNDSALQRLLKKLKGDNNNNDDNDNHESPDKLEDVLKELKN